MPTTKSIIVPSVSTALTAAYTNASGSNATLKAINAAGIGDITNWTTSAGTASEWTSAATPNPTFVGPPQATAGNVSPFPVQLSDDRVLLLWTPANLHCGAGLDYLGGTVLHTQIVEYTGTGYRAGPVVNISLPFAYFNSKTVGLWSTPSGVTSIGQSLARAVALTSTKVALVLRNSTAFTLLRLNISGNSVDQANVVNLDLTSVSAFSSTGGFAFDVAPVRGNTNKVVVLGSNGTNWSMQSYNIPDSGSLTVDSALFNTGLTHTTHHCALAPLSLTIAATTTTYVVAANTTTNVTVSVQNFSFNSSTSAFASVGTPVTYTATATQGIAARCLSSDGTANAVVSLMNTASNTTIYFLRQTSLTQAAATATTATLPSSVSRAMVNAYNWGNSRAVFQGTSNALVVFDSAGTSTPMVSAAESASTTACLTYFYPFNSRPLYTINDNTPTFIGRVAQFIARTNITTATSVGDATLVNNYFPHGYPYSGNMSWSDKAQCFMVGQGGRVYAITDTGVVLNETTVYALSSGLGSSSPLINIKQLQVTPSGKIIFLTDAYGTNATYYNGLQWTAAVSYGFATYPVTSPQYLSSVAILSVSSTFSYVVATSLATYVDSSNVERALGLYIGSANLSAVRFDGGTWAALGATAVTTAAFAAGYSFGARPNLQLIQDSPCDATNQTGLWRIIGALGLNNAANMGYQGISTTAYSDASILSANTSTTINGTTAAIYPANKSDTSLSTALAFYDTNASVGRYYFVFRGRLVTGLYGYTISGANTMQFMNVANTKYGFSAAPCSTNTSVVSPLVYSFDAATAPSGPKYTLSGTSGNGWVTVDRSGQTAINLFASGVNTSYAIPGPDTALLHVTISSLSSDFYVTSVSGQPIGTSTSDAYRNGDVYFVPDGYSVKLKTNLPGSLSAMLSIVEEV